MSARAAVEVLSEVGEPTALPVLAALRGSDFPPNLSGLRHQDCVQPHRGDGARARRKSLERSDRRHGGRVRQAVRISLSPHRHDVHRNQALLCRTPHVRADGRRPAPASFASYFARLRSDLNGEVEQFINALTVNETYFYREDHQLQCMTTDLLTRAAEEQGARATRSASGRCPVRRAKSLIPSPSGCWRTGRRSIAHEIEIVGSDIDTRVLEAARQGYFGKRALMRLSPELIDKYFDRIGRGALAHPRGSAPIGALHTGQSGGARRHRPAWPVRHHLLPQRPDLFRRCLPPHRGRKPL